MSQPPPSGTPESILFQRIVDKDRDAFKELYALYHRRIFAYLMKLLSDREIADEVLNDVMFEVWRQAGTFKGQSKLATWMFGIAHNKALNALRGKGQRQFADLEEADTSVQASDNPQILMEKSEQGEKIQSALQHLSEEHRAVIELTFYQGFSYIEIASIVNCPVNTVKTRMFHARRRLKELLRKVGL